MDSQSQHSDLNGTTEPDHTTHAHQLKAKNLLRLSEGQKVYADSLVLQNLEFLGRGGNGCVFRMMVREGLYKGLIVAVKFLEADDGNRVERFRKEIEILQSLSHPHIVSTYGTGTLTQNKANFPFYVLDSVVTSC